MKRKTPRAELRTAPREELALVQRGTLLEQREVGRPLDQGPRDKRPRRQGKGRRNQRHPRHRRWRNSTACIVEHPSTAGTHANLRESETNSTANLGMSAPRRWNDCGPAAVAWLAAYHGCHAEATHEFRAFEPGPRGSTLLELSEFLERLGLSPEGLHSSWAGLQHVNLPAIAHLRGQLDISGKGAGPLNLGHFVVCTGWSPREARIVDPARVRAPGARIVSRRRFCLRWSGYLLALAPREALGNADRRE